MPVPKCLEGLEKNLNEGVERWHIPGASIAVLYNGEIFEAVAGVNNADTKFAATPETLFAYGSVSKILTATTILRLVCENKINLDSPASEYVPEFKAANAIVDKDNIIRRLISHSSGLVGIIFKDTGWGNDALSVQIGSPVDFYAAGWGLAGVCTAGRMGLVSSDTMAPP